MGHFNCMVAPNPGIEVFIKSAILQDEGEWKKYIEEAKKLRTWKTPNCLLSG